MLDRARIALRDGLGLEPSEAVRELHGAILRHEPELHASRLGLDGWAERRSMSSEQLH